MRRRKQLSGRHPEEIGWTLSSVVEVATQKIVLVITGDNKEERQQEKPAQIWEALTFSKMAAVILYFDEMALSRENPDAVDTGRRIVQLLGYCTCSFEDLAVAVRDETENPKHIRQRFTVAY